jgi:LPS sulfotransferase NodH
MINTTNLSVEPRQAHLEGLIAQGEVGWRHLYAELDLTPHEVVYENLANSDGYEAIIRGVLNHLGLGNDNVAIPVPRTRRQSNELNEEWVVRYLDDCVDR